MNRYDLTHFRLAVFYFVQCWFLPKSFEFSESNLSDPIMPGLQSISSAVVSSKGPSTIRFMDQKGNLEAASPCSSPVTLKRRFTREPVRGPESAQDLRFDNGITFSFQYPSVQDLMQMHIISSFNSQSPSRLPSAAPSPMALIDTEDSGRESECDSELELESVGADLPYSSYDDDRVVETFKARKPAQRSTAPSASRKPKQCACCGCTSTPLWRDMGKEMPLCNACGIRWKKYGIVCDVCQYVPCKQERENKNCKRCSAVLPMSAKRVRVMSPQTVQTVPKK